jgi:RNA polymerase sigma-70 factor (ECF subfamily)
MTMRPREQEAEFLVLVEQHKRVLYKVAYGYCRNAEDRADLVQDILIELWKSFAKFDGRCQFSTWMYRVAVNVAISFYRGESRRIRDALPIEDVAAGLIAAEQAFAADSDNMRALGQLLNELDELSRALVILFLEGLAHDEIGQVLGISASNVGTRLNRIKTRLQQSFAAA